MRYSIITPTLMRPTIVRLCQSIDLQTDGDWEHLIAVDNMPKQPDRLSVLEQIEGSDPRRKLFFYNTAHVNDCGNSVRRRVFEHAKGDYIFYIDDDDYLADENVLMTLEQVVADWAIFPVLSRGNRCYFDPPAIHRTGSCMFIAKRECEPRFPANNDYSADGQVVEALKKKFRYQALPDERPLVIYEQANHGEYNIVPEALREERKKKRIKKMAYASDGMTLDWNDYH